MKNAIRAITILISVLCVSPALAISVSPAVLEVSLAPGESGQYELTLANESDGNMLVSGRLESFRPKGDGGEAEILPPQTANQALGWVRLPADRLALEPYQYKKVPLVVNVPPTADVGGYYLATVWAGQDPAASSGQGVSLSGQVASLILLEVKGESRRELVVTDFRLAGEKSLFDSLPVAFEAVLANTGTVHLKPQGQVIVKDAFGKVTAILPLNEAEGNVLPKSSRKFDLVWGDKGSTKGFWADWKREITGFRIGKFSAVLEVRFDEPSRSVSSPEVSFWIVPWRTLGAVIILIIIIILSIRIRRWKKRPAAGYGPGNPHLMS